MAYAENQITLEVVTDGQGGEDGATIWTATANATTPNYTFNISDLTGQTGRTPQVGDLVVRSYYRYTIASVGSTTVLTNNRTSIRGSTGAAGADGTTFTPSVDAAGDISWTNDGGKTNPATQNIMGPQGDDGTTFTPSVDADGYISWTNDGGKTNPATQNIKGPQGPPGADTSSQYMAFSTANGLRVYSGSKDSSTYNTSYTQIKTDGVTIAQGGKEGANFTYSEDGSAFGLSDSHRVVVAKATDESGYRNDATLSSRKVSTFLAATTPMAFVNVNHKSSGSYKYGEVGMYAWAGDNNPVPSYVILTKGTTDSVLGKSNALVISAGNFSIATNGDISSTQVNGLVQDVSDAQAAIDDLETFAWQTIKDSVIAQGTSGNWRYRKWSSGFIEAWHESTATASATTAVNISSRTVSYRSTWSVTIPSAIGFTSTPKIIVSLGSSSDIRMSINGAASSTTAIDGYCWRTSSNSSTYDITPRIYAWGS